MAQGYLPSLSGQRGSIKKTTEIVAEKAKDVTQFVKDNIGTIAATTGGVVVGAGTAALVTSKVIKKKKKASTKRKTTRKKSYRYKYKKKSRRKRQKKPYTARKRKDTSHRRIRYTKNNQPYIILRSGKARFIKKRSVSSSRKRKGGKY